MRFKLEEQEGGSRMHRPLYSYSKNQVFNVSNHWGGTGAGQTCTLEAAEQSDSMITIFYETILFMTLLGYSSGNSITTLYTPPAQSVPVEKSMKNNYRELSYR